MRLVSADFVAVRCLERTGGRDRRRYRCLLLLAAAAFSPTIPYAQQSPGPDEIRVSSQPYAPQSPYTVRVETKLVDMVVAVRDGHGRAIHGLKKDNFQIYDDGRERAIASFSEDTGAASGTVAPSATVPSAAAPSGDPAAKAGEPQTARFLAWISTDNNSPKV